MSHGVEHPLSVSYHLRVLGDLESHTDEDSLQSRLSFLVRLSGTIPGAGLLADWAPRATRTGKEREGHSVSEREDIRRVIERAYIEGIHQDQDEAKVRSGFHPDFRMLVRQDMEIVEVDPMAFVQMMRERRETNPGFFESALSFDIPLIDVEGSAAVARIELRRGGRNLFTDYQLLYKFEDGWKIVSKIFHAHS